MAVNVEWPEDKRFAICLTHDVDRVDKKWWHSLYYFLKTGRGYHLKTLITKYRQNPYWNFGRIMELEDKYGVRSTFFFLNESKKPQIFNPKTYPLSFGYYNITDPKLVEIIKLLDEGGWEIAVHGSYDSYKNIKLLKEEKKTLESVVGHEIIGIRQHYLNLEIPTTWRLQKEVGFKYDASFGYRRDVGFRENKIIPFKPFGDEDDFLVIPTTIMDSALFYKYPSPETAWRRILEIFKYAEKNGALVTVLWHQRVFNENEFPDWSRIYEKIIQEGLRRGAWFATCEEIWEVFK